MKLRLQRVQLEPDVTIGALDVDGQFECWTLEDPVRPDGVKIPGETAIPFGAYSVELSMSPRFKVIMPLLVNVNGFVGIRIHWGNSTEDTDGCILVGKDHYKDAKTIGRSRIAWNALMDKLNAARDRRESISLEVVT